MSASQSNEWWSNNYLTYHSIETTSNSKRVELFTKGNLVNKCQWVVTEKIHGSNFSFITNGKQIKCAKRSKPLLDSDEYYGFHNVKERYSSNILKVWEIMSSKNLIKTKNNYSSSLRGKREEEGEGNDDTNINTNDANANTNNANINTDDSNVNINDANININDSNVNANVNTNDTNINTNNSNVNININIDDSNVNTNINTNVNINDSNVNTNNANIDSNVNTNANDADDEEKVIIIFGELFGGVYSHPDVKPDESSIRCQFGIEYCPQNEFMSFDIYDGKDFLDYDVMTEVLEESGLPYLKPLLRGSFDDAFKYDPEFISTIPDLFGLPPLSFQNKAEGVIIKPVLNLRTINRKRVILKIKTPDFYERVRNKKRQFTEELRKKELQSMDEMFNELETFINENRLNNILSKFAFFNRTFILIHQEEETKKKRGEEQEKNLCAWDVALQCDFSSPFLSRQEISKRDDAKNNLLV